MQLQARWVEAAAAAEDARTSPTGSRPTGCSSASTPTVEPTVFRGPTLSTTERRGAPADRGRRAARAGAAHRHRRASTFDDGSSPTDPGHVHVDCTAAGRAADRAATGLRARPDHAAVRHARVRAVGRRHHRRGRGDAGTTTTTRTACARPWSSPATRRHAPLRPGRHDRAWPRGVEPDLAAWDGRAA